MKYTKYRFTIEGEINKVFGDHPVSLIGEHIERQISGYTAFEAEVRTTRIDVQKIGDEEK